MKYTSICNTDSKGRIVIPSKIRDFLNMKDGESLEIELINQEIRMRKCRNPYNDASQFLTFLTILYHNIRHPVLICSDRQVIAAKGVFVSNTTPFPEALTDHIKTGTEVTSGQISDIYLAPHLKEPIAGIFPVNTEKHLVLIVLSRTYLTETESICARMVATAINHVLLKGV